MTDEPTAVRPEPMPEGVEGYMLEKLDDALADAAQRLRDKGYHFTSEDVIQRAYLYDALDDMAERHVTESDRALPDAPVDDDDGDEEEDAS